MRHFALVLATLALSGCESDSATQAEGTPPLADAQQALEERAIIPFQVHALQQEAQLLERLEDVLSRDDIAPADRAALAEITALLEETN